MNGNIAGFALFLILVAAWVGATIAFGYAGLITMALVMVGLCMGAIIIFAKG